MNSATLRLPAQSFLGRGALAEAADVVSALGTRVFVCTDTSVAAIPAVRKSIEHLASRCEAVDVYTETPPELPVDSVESCAERARAAGADVIVGFGGGSCLDMAKLTSLLATTSAPLRDHYASCALPQVPLPVVAIPTTAGTGSEVTGVAVLTDPARRLKIGISSPQLIPVRAICDPELTLTCPRGVTAASGADALVHAVESYLAPPLEPRWGDGVGLFTGASPLTAPLALEATRLIFSALPRVTSDGTDIEAREQMMIASHLAGISFGQAGTAGAHALQYAVGAATHTSHGLGVGLLIPYILDFVLPSAIRGLADLGAMIGLKGNGANAIARGFIAAVADLLDAIGIPRTLQDIGVAKSDLERLTTDALTVTRLLQHSPRRLGRAEIREIFLNAWAGRLPAIDRAGSFR